MKMVLVLLWSYRMKWHCAMLSVNYCEFDSDNIVTPESLFYQPYTWTKCFKKHSE